MIVIGCDPGYEQSALVAWDGTRILFSSTNSNQDVLDLLRLHSAGMKDPTVLVIEQIEAMGMAVGKTTFETVFWSGRFAEAYAPDRWERVSRTEIKLHHCHQRRAKDSEIRQAIIDRFGPTKEKAIGTKKAQGPLYELSGHEWAAFAVALTWYDQNATKPGEVRPGVTADF